MDPAFAPVASPPAPTPAPTLIRANVFAVIAHALMFGALGWFLAEVAAFRVVFEDLGAELPIPTAVLMNVSTRFESMGVPLWMMAILLAVTDIAVYWQLEKRGRLQAAHNWMWIVTAAVLPVTLTIQWLLFRPFVALIESMR